MWLTAVRAGKRLEISKTMVPKVALATGIRRRHLPGMKYVRYLEEDVARVANENIIGEARQPHGVAS